MKRKIIKLGSATLVASIPSKWIKKQKLKPGQEIDITEDKNNLVISTKPIKTVKKAKLDITTLPRYRNYYIIGLYTLGIDELTITTKDVSKLENFYEHPLSHLVGWEIVEQTKNLVVIKDFMHGQDEDYQSLIRRVFHLMSSIIHDMEDALQKGNYDLNYVNDMDKNINRFCYLLGRKLYNEGYTNYEHTPFMYYFSVMFEATGDKYRDLAEYISEKKLVLSKKSVDFFKRVNKIFFAFSDLFYKYDLNEAAKIDDKYREMRKELEKYVDGIKSPQEIRAVIFIAEISDYLIELLRNSTVVFAAYDIVPEA